MVNFLQNLGYLRKEETLPYNPFDYTIFTVQIWELSRESQAFLKEKVRQVLISKSA